MEQGSVAGDIAKGGQHSDILLELQKKRKKTRVCKDAVVGVQDPRMLKYVDVKLGRIHMKAVLAE